MLTVQIIDGVVCDVRNMVDFYGQPFPIPDDGTHIMVEDFDIEGIPEECNELIDCGGDMALRYFPEIYNGKIEHKNKGETF